MASLAILSGATGRIAQVGAVFGGHHWVAIFGPVVMLGLLLLVVRAGMTRSFDRPFAMGLAVMAVVTFAQDDSSVARRFEVSQVSKSRPGAPDIFGKAGF